MTTIRIKDPKIKLKKTEFESEAELAVYLDLLLDDSDDELSADEVIAAQKARKDYRENPDSFKRVTTR